MESTKTANQLYRESGSTLPFSEWITQQKATNVDSFIKNEPLNQLIAEEKQKLGIATQPTSNYFNSSNKVFGLSKNVILISGGLILAAISIKIYQNFKK